jgi:hypothetical protein
MVTRRTGSRRSGDGGALAEHIAHYVVGPLEDPKRFVDNEVGHVRGIIRTPVTHEALHEVAILEALGRGRPLDAIAARLNDGPEWDRIVRRAKAGDPRARAILNRFAPPVPGQPAEPFWKAPPGSNQDRYANAVYDAINAGKDLAGSALRGNRRGAASAAGRGVGAVARGINAYADALFGRRPQ